MENLIVVHDCATDEIVEREMTEDELAQRIVDEAAALERTEALAAKQAARQALLDRLGITAEEAALILG